MYSCFCIILISYSSVIVWCTDNRYTHVNKPVEKLSLSVSFSFLQKKYSSIRLLALALSFHKINTVFQK